jgi:hypothetical protein
MSTLSLIKMRSPSNSPEQWIRGLSLVDRRLKEAGGRRKEEGGRRKDKEKHENPNTKNR